MFDLLRSFKNKCIKACSLTQNVGKSTNTFDVEDKYFTPWCEIKQVIY